ncbi:MAG: hypothetical protein DCF22_17800 [Leptolyngbya sp.]|nr:MAG: hypothetical protein DCF22_17800 [Leptolyngbya sp.]
MTIEGWETGILGKLCRISIGGTPTRNNPTYWDSGKETENLWVSIRDMNQRVITDTSEYITDTGIKNSNAKTQYQGTVLLSFKLTIGRVAFAGRKLYTNEAIAALETDNLDSTFLYYGLQQWDLLQDVDQAIKGATLNKAKLNKIQFDYPNSIEEQTQIAAILSTVDRAIEQTKAIIAKQQRIKTGLMQDLLTKGIDEDGNVRSEATHAFKDSPLKRIPVEWEIKATQDFCSEIVDCPHSTPAYEPAGIPCIRTADMVPGQLLLNTAWRVSEKIYKERILRLEPRKGDIIYSREGERLGIASPVGEERVCLGQRVMLLRPDTDTDSTYFLWSMNADDYYRRAIKGLGATTSPHINVKDIKLTPMRCPPSQEQKTIGKVLAQHHYDYAANLNMLSKLSRLQMGLMQDLLTGNVRVTALLNDPKTAQV